MRLAAVSRLVVQADFAEMLVGFLVFKGFDDIGQREVTVNDRAPGRCSPPRWTLPAIAACVVVAVGIFLARIGFYGLYMGIAL